MKLAVIGGAGFLGSHLVSACEAGGIDAVSLDIVPGRGRHVVGDAFDADTLKSVIEGADAVWIRAGMLGGRSSTDVGAAAEYLRRNTELPRLVLEACDALRCRTVLFDSTEQVFGTSGDLERQDAWAEPRAASFYGASKAITEKMIRLWSAAGDGRSAQIFRYSRVRAGATKDVLYWMTANALAGKPIRIMGNPAHRVSFVHVEDVIAANLRALERRPRYAIYNVSCDRPFSLFGLAQLVQAVTGRSAPLQFEAPESWPDFEPFVVGMEWEESAAVLGMRPRWSTAAMIAETAALIEQ
jgi:nucleoside-diphosphate-sugar epimerase